MTSTLSLRGLNIQRYTFNAIRDVFIELFCAPKPSLDNPNLRTSPTSRSFCVMEEGDMDGVAGFWGEDEDTGEVGFLPEWKDVFWVYDDNTYAWASHHFRGRKIRRGSPKGKGKGKGKGGRFRFRSRKGKGKGKGKGVYAHWGDGETAYAVKGKGKGKKGKGKKGKEKGEGKDGKNPAGKGPQAHLAETKSSNPASTSPDSSQQALSYQDDSWYYQGVYWTDDSWWTGDA